MMRITDSLDRKSPIVELHPEIIFVELFLSMTQHFSLLDFAVLD